MGARNETVQFAIQINKVPADSAKGQGALRLGALTGADATLPAEVLSAYQVLSMPFDDNRGGVCAAYGVAGFDARVAAGFAAAAAGAEHAGDAGASEPGRSDESAIAGGGGRGGAVLVWVDVAIPPTAKPGAYETRCELMEDGQVVATLPVKLSVYDFVIPDERHLTMVGRVKWKSLEDLYPSCFEAVTPRLISRTELKYANTVRTLDQLVKMAQCIGRW